MAPRHHITHIRARLLLYINTHPVFQWIVQIGRGQSYLLSLSPYARAIDITYRLFLRRMALAMVQPVTQG